MKLLNKNIRIAVNCTNALWDGNGGRVILNKHRMPAQELGRIAFNQLNQLKQSAFDSRVQSFVQLSNI